MPVKRGELFWVDLDPVKGSEQSGRRPVLVLQNDIGNVYAPTTIVASLTTSQFAKEYPTNVFLPKSTDGLKFNSTVMLSQIRVIDKTRLQNKIGRLSQKFMDKVDEAIKVSLGLSYKKFS